MKKLLCIIAVFAMLFCLCACGEDVRGTVSTDDTTQSTQNAQTGEEGFSMGKATGGTYQNNFLGMTFALPDGWEFYTEKQILELNNLVGDLVDEETVKKLEKANLVYDMYATNPTSGDSVVVVLEKATAVQLALSNLKASVEAQIPTIQNAYTDMGYTNIETEYQKVMVSGKAYDGLRLEATIGGVGFYSTSFCFKKGTYVANVTLSSLQNDQTDLLLDQFTFA